MVTERDFIYGLLLPFFAALCLWAWTLRRAGAADAATEDAPQAEDAAIGSAAAPAMLLGYLLAHDALYSAPPLPPADVVQWVYFGAAALLGATALVRAVRLPRWAGGLLSAGVLVATSALLLRPQAAQIGMLWGTGWCLAFLLSAESLRWKLHLDGGFATTLALVGIGFLNALVLVTSGSQSYGQLAAVAPAALAAGLLVRLRGGPVPAPAEAAAAYVLLCGGLLACGRIYAEATLLNASLLAVAPLGLWIAHVPGVRSLAAWKRGAVTVVAAVAPAAVAAVLAVLRFREAMANPYHGVY